MTVSLPMCAIDFTNDAMGPEEAAIADRIAELKESLGDDLLILGHHYQRDQIVMHADLLGRFIPALRVSSQIQRKKHRFLRSSLHG